MDAKKHDTGKPDDDAAAGQQPAGKHYRVKNPMTGHREGDIKPASAFGDGANLNWLLANGMLEEVEPGTEGFGPPGTRPWEYALKAGEAPPATPVGVAAGTPANPVPAAVAEGGAALAAAPAAAPEKTEETPGPARKDSPDGKAPTPGNDTGRDEGDARKPMTGGARDAHPPAGQSPGNKPHDPKGDAAKRK